MSKYVPYEERIKTLLAEKVSVADIASKLKLSERAVRLHQARADGKMSTKQLVEVTGASYRQINYWTVKEYLTPIDLGEVKGEGTQRKGSGSEVMFEPEVKRVVDLVLELISIGFEVDSAFLVARQMDASGALNHGGSGEHATAMIVFPHGWKLVKAVS